MVLVGSEPMAPYERPHLSKGYIMGSVPRGSLRLRPPNQYTDLGIELRTGQEVVDLGTERRVALASGSELSWDLLCVATGASARVLAGFEDGLYLRELRDADALRSTLKANDSVRVIGAGFIGCEVAAAARMLGLRVDVYEELAQPLIRVLGPELGAYLAGVHRARGVEMHLSVGTLPPLVSPLVVGVGSVPRTWLAERAGLEVDSGIIVDAQGRTSADGVFAAGDATRFFSPLYEKHIRVEHFQTSQRQGFVVGRAMAGASEPYREVPWFWSDQYDVNLQYAGAGLAWDETVIRGEMGKPPFTVFHLAGGRPIAATGVNDHHTVARARHLMEARRPVTRTQLEDPGFDLRRALA